MGAGGGDGTGRDARGGEAGTAEEPGEREAAGRGGRCGDAGGARVAEPRVQGAPCGERAACRKGPRRAASCRGV